MPRHMGWQGQRENRSGWEQRVMGLFQETLKHIHVRIMEGSRKHLLSRPTAGAEAKRCLGMR